MTYREPPSGWYAFGTHAGWDKVPPLQFSDETDEAGMPLFERRLPVHIGDVASCPNRVDRNHPDYPNCTDDHYEMPERRSYNPARLSVELVPATCWWTNVRSNVTRAQWEVCKRYSKTKTDDCCIICGGRGSRYATEAHEIWDYDDDNQIQTLVDIVPLCPTCHKVKHLGRTREVSSFAEWSRVLNHLQRVNNWPAWKVEKYVELTFAIWAERSKMSWSLDVSLLSMLGIDVEVKDRA